MAIQCADLRLEDLLIELGQPVIWRQAVHDCDLSQPCNGFVRYAIVR
jgi:hypothetical protein